MSVLTLILLVLLFCAIVFLVQRKPFPGIWNTAAIIICVIVIVVLLAPLLGLGSLGTVDLD